MNTWETLAERPILILQTGSAPRAIQRRYGDYDHMFVRAGGLEKLAARHLVRRVHVARGERPEKPRVYAGVLVTGSDAMVTDRLPWSEAAAGWLRDALDAGLPVFGVCYGHQLLAHALGGVVEDHPAGLELGTREISLSPRAGQEPLLGDMPRRCTANLFHTQTVASLPKGAEVLAGSAHDPHQILRYAPMVWSTQFHPEFDGEIMAAFLEEERAVGNPAARHAEAADAPHALTMLRRFVERISGLAKPGGEASGQQ
ncbi:MAG: glutamine amidotransferase [Azoarcus sp.]|jgi:GMP synthase (glutamine-hydrolysing)|nr:glutamine amidotransferase [Azoarcus sp.]